jgi:cbb3-type cytochrome oxidase subunit 3
MFWARFAAIAVLVMMGIPIVLMWIRFFRKRKKANDDKQDYFQSNV